MCAADKIGRTTNREGAPPSGPIMANQVVHARGRTTPQPVPGTWQGDTRDSGHPPVQPAGHGFATWRSAGTVSLAPPTSPSRYDIAAAMHTDQSTYLRSFRLALLPERASRCSEFLLRLVHGHAARAAAEVERDCRCATRSAGGRCWRGGRTPWPPAELSERTGPGKPLDPAQNRVEAVISY
jgi:hypothetical protein